MFVSPFVRLYVIFLLRCCWFFLVSSLFGGLGTMNITQYHNDRNECVGAAAVARVHKLASLRLFPAIHFVCIVFDELLVSILRSRTKLQANSKFFVSFAVDIQIH